MTNGLKTRIAIIGSGISGLSAAWLLSQKHDVTVFEKEGYPGGHSNTRTVELSSGAVPVDTGFIVYNERNYPNLTALFSHLDVQTNTSEMSFSFSLDHGRYEYSGGGWNGLFGQRSNVVNMNHWRMLKDIQRFFSEAPARINDYPRDLPLGAFLQAENYSPAFLDDHILPMAGAIWSSPIETMRLFPARSFIEFYANHGLLQIHDRPQWRSVAGGAREYVSRLSENGNFSVSTNRHVTAVRRSGEHVYIHEFNGQVHQFDNVVFACHADAALNLLSDRDALEQEILGNFSYSDNRAVLHSDDRHMPRRKGIWSSWNYLRESGLPKERVSASVTYWMNRLQRLDTDENLFVTINPSKAINTDMVHYEVMYRHPILDGNAVDAQTKLWKLQGRNRSWFCGSYFGYGFHEDGLQSGLAVAEQLGGLRRPWSVENESGRIHRDIMPVLEAAE